MTISSLSLNWERIKRLVYCSFEIKKGEFSKIKLLSNKQGREENGSVIKKDQYLEASKLF